MWKTENHRGSPLILDLVKTDDEAYFENAVIALGLVGGEEAYILRNIFKMKHRAL